MGNTVGPNGLSIGFQPARLIIEIAQVAVHEADPGGGEPVRNVATLPVAGLPLRQGKSHLVRRGKIRPAVVIAIPGVPIEAAFKRSSAKWQHSPTVLLAPYYLSEADGSRGGSNPEFVSRIQRAEYSQYVWDLLPVGDSDEGSIPRLDHIFPVG